LFDIVKKMADTARNAPISFPHRMVWAVLIFCMCLCVIHVSTPKADFFLKPKQAQTQKKKSLKSFWAKVWRKKNNEKHTQAPYMSSRTSPLAKKPQQYDQKSHVRFNGFEVYHAAKNVDPALLYSDGRDPVNATELQLVSAAHNTTKIADILATRNEIRKQMAQIKKQEEVAALRRSLNKSGQAIRAVSPKKQATTPPRKTNAPSGHNIYKKQGTSKPARVFTDFR
jgi:hypothetical protein